MKVELTPQAINVIKDIGVVPFARLANNLKPQSLYTYMNKKSCPSFKNRKKIINAIRTVWKEAKFNDIFYYKTHGTIKSNS